MKIKKLISIVVFLFPFLLFSQTVIIDGFAFLESETSHENVTITLERIAPSSLTYTAYSDVSGSFSSTVESGVYTVTYEKTDFITQQAESSAFYANTTVNSVTLESAGLHGTLSGVLPAGNYKVSSNINVQTGQSLVIKPGTTLRFKDGSKFLINGNLSAEGTKTDSIIFTSYDPEGSWEGIDIYGSNSSATCSYCRIENSASSGIYVNDSENIHLNHSLFRNNSGSFVEDSYYGGGFFIHDGQATIDACIFTQNHFLLKPEIHYSLDCCGTAIGTWSSQLNISNSLFYKNLDSEDVIDLNGNCVIENCIITNNKSNGISSGSGNTVIRNTIISDNLGYAISVYPEVYSQLTVNNSIFWNNTSGNFEYNQDGWYETIVTVNENGVDCDAYKNIFADPLLSDTLNHDFTLKSESPCINAGKNDISTTKDFAGNTRIFGDFADMGIYEYGAPAYDIIDPSITSSHEDKTLIADQNCQITLPDYTSSVQATDNLDTDIAITQNPEAGTILAIGNHLIELIATDDSNNSTKVSFNITVKEEIKPTIECPSNQNVSAAISGLYSVVGTEFDPINTDDNCGIQSVSNNYNLTETLSGVALPVGTTPVLWTVTDMSGNEESCSYNIQVSAYVNSEILTDEDFRIFPNPIQKTLNINSNGHSIDKLQLTDIAGKIVMEKINIGQNATLDLSNLKSGIYSISLFTTNEIFTSKILKN